MLVGGADMQFAICRVMRDIGRKIAGEDELREAFVRPAEHVLIQNRHQRSRKVYSLHAPEVECIGKGKAHKPYELGVKVSVATTLKHWRGGQFVAHVVALRTTRMTATRAQRRTVARSRSCADVRTAHGVHVVRHHQRRRATELARASRAAKLTGAQWRN
jgi:hypothetical protein